MATVTPKSSSAPAKSHHGSDSASPFDPTTGVAVIAGAAADAHQAEAQSLLRKKYKLHPGDRVDLVDCGNVLAIVPVSTNPILAARGMLKDDTSLVNALHAERRQARSCTYIVEREHGLLQAQTMIGMVEQLPIEIVEADRAHVFAAAHLKARVPISYAGASAVSLAQQRQAIVLTGEPPVCDAGIDLIASIFRIRIVQPVLILDGDKVGELFV